MLVESFEGGDRESTSTFFRPERARESERVSERARESGRKADTHFQPSEKRTRQLWPKRRIIIDPSESLSSPFSGLFLLSLSLSLSLLFFQFLRFLGKNSFAAKHGKLGNNIFRYEVQKTKTSFLKSYL